jgi:hypothetical protein
MLHKKLDSPDPGRDQNMLILSQAGEPSVNRLGEYQHGLKYQQDVCIHRSTFPQFNNV